MSKQISRRSFIKHVTAAGIAMPLILPRLSFAKSPNGRIQHAVIGATGQGGYDMAQIFSHGNVDIVALCDIDETNLQKAAALHPQARLYRDWREMLDVEEKNIDSVQVSTPDHTHAPATMSAIRIGKHVYCEKPLTHDVYEARKVTLAARKKGVATQMGNQIHSHDFYRTAVQWVREGAIGKVKNWHSWSGAQFTNDTKKRPAGSDPIPANVDWNLWLGTAPEREYKAEIYHPFWWRTYRDFGGGAVGDFGCHIFDPVYSSLDIGNPLSIIAESESVSDEVYPGWTFSTYEMEGSAMTVDKTIMATWRDGGKKPEVSESKHLPADLELPPSGSMLIGEEGTLIIPHVGPPKLYPLEKFANYPTPTFEPRNHYHQFVEAAMGNGIGGSNFDFAGPMTEAVLLGNIANRFPGEKLEWNAKRCRFNNHREANKFLRRRYRKGFKVRGL